MGIRNLRAICPNCGGKITAQPKGVGHLTWAQLQVHHVLSVAAGGANTADNLVTLCTACHARAHAPDGTGGRASTL